MKTAADWASQIHATNEAASLERLIAALREAPNVASVLDELSRSRDPVLRAWVADHAVPVLGRAGIPLAWNLVDDADPDVRDVALEVLTRVDEAGKDKIVARLRRSALTKDKRDFHGPPFAIWKLVDIGAPGLDSVLDEIETAPVWPWHRDVVMAARLVIRQDDARLAALIADPAVHNHDSNPSLMSAATRLPTDRVLEATENCASADPELRCRQECSFAGKEILARRAQEAQRPR